jgi:hypothetical protein
MIYYAHATKCVLHLVSNSGNKHFAGVTIWAVPDDNILYNYHTNNRDIHPSENTKSDWKKKNAVLTFRCKLDSLAHYINYLLITWVSVKLNCCANVFRSAPTTYWLLSNACSNLSSCVGEKAVRTLLGLRKGCSRKSVKKGESISIKRKKKYEEMSKNYH